MRKPRTKDLPPEIVALRGLPADQRAEALVAMFKFCTTEFAVMVLEHTKPKRRRKKR